MVPWSHSYASGASLSSYYNPRWMCPCQHDSDFVTDLSDFEFRRDLGGGKKKPPPPPPPQFDFDYEEYEDEDDLDLGFMKETTEHQIFERSTLLKERKLDVKISEFELDPNMVEVKIAYESEDWFKPTVGKTGGITCIALPEVPDGSGFLFNPGRNLQDERRDMSSTSFDGFDGF